MFHILCNREMAAKLNQMKSKIPEASNSKFPNVQVSQMLNNLRGWSLSTDIFDFITSLWFLRYSYDKVITYNNCIFNNNQYSNVSKLAFRRACWMIRCRSREVCWKTFLVVFILRSCRFIKLAARCIRYFFWHLTLTTEISE